MKKLRPIVLLSVILLLISALSLPASAAKSSEVIYENDFENGVIDDSFVITYGTLKVVSEKGEKFLRCSNENNKVFFAYGPTDQKDVDISFKFRATVIANATNSKICPFFRSPHIPAWDTVSYQLQFKTYDTSLIFADRFADDNQLLQIANYPDFGMSIGLWNNVQISTRGERIIVNVNGMKILDTVDTGYGLNGGFGFSASQASFDLDDIVITRHYGDTLPEPELNEKPLWMGSAEEEEEPDIADTGIIRIDLTTIGQNKKPTDNAINYIDPAKATVYTWIALGGAVLCGAVSTVGFIFIFKKRRKAK